MSSRSWSKGPMIEATDPKCECGAPLVMSSDGNGLLMERCQNGCFKRAVPTRRPTCPECGSGPWGEKTGCEDCGFGVPEKRPARTAATSAAATSAA